MTIATDAADTAIDALKQLDQPELYCLGTYTSADAVPIEAGGVIRRNDSQSPKGTRGQQHKGARLMLDMRDVVVKPVAGATWVVADETFTIITADRGIRFWHCEATTPFPD